VKEVQERKDVKDGEEVEKSEIEGQVLFAAPFGKQNLKFEMRNLKWGILEAKVDIRD